MQLMCGVTIPCSVLFFTFLFSFFLSVFMTWTDQRLLMLMLMINGVDRLLIITLIRACFERKNFIGITNFGKHWNRQFFPRFKRRFLRASLAQLMPASASSILRKSRYCSVKPFCKPGLKWTRSREKIVFLTSPALASPVKLFWMSRAKGGRNSRWWFVSSWVIHSYPA